jgi:hypothetical protein
MTPVTKKHQQLILLEPEQAKLLDNLAAESRIPKQVLLREAVHDLLSLNSKGEISRRVKAVRTALKKARGQLMAYRRDIQGRNAGVIPLKNCDEAIAAIDEAREEFGD